VKHSFMKNWMLLASLVEDNEKKLLDYLLPLYLGSQSDTSTYLKEK